jgi:potassium/hydrogen antiporter
VFFVVLLSALVQGTTITPLANYLKLSGKDKPPLAHTIELVSIGKTNNEMIEVHINDEAYINGMAIKDIDLPEKTLISAVIRENDLITPTGDTIIIADDTLYVLASKSQRKHINHLLNAKKEPGESIKHGPGQKQECNAAREPIPGLNVENAVEVQPGFNQNEKKDNRPQSESDRETDAVQERESETASNDSSVKKDQ